MVYIVDDIEVSLGEYCEKYNTGYYTESIFDSKYVLTIDPKKKKTALRKQRRYIFINGFDVYKSNYDYGLEEPETKEEHQEIVEWYNKMLDIEQTEIAIQNIPERIKKYMD